MSSKRLPILDGSDLLPVAFLPASVETTTGAQTKATAAQTAATSAAATDATTKANAAQAAAIAVSAQRASNLSDLASATTARTNLGLGGAATLAVGTTAGTVAAGDDARLVAVAGDFLTTGEMVPRDRNKFVANVATLTTGTLALSYFTADKTETITTLTAYTGTTAAAATPTICRMGIYSVAANGNLTLVASTPNDTTLFAAASTSYPKALSVSLSKTAGQRYATGILVVSGTTMPSFHGIQLLADTPMNSILMLAPAISGRATGQTDLPGSLTAAGVSGFHGIIAMLLS